MIVFLKVSLRAKFKCKQGVIARQDLLPLIKILRP